MGLPYGDQSLDEPQTKLVDRAWHWCVIAMPCRRMWMNDMELVIR
jgi:hypothetical protein